MCAFLRNVRFLVLFNCTQFSMFGLATFGANPANASTSMFCCSPSLHVY